MTLLLVSLFGRRDVLGIEPREEGPTPLALGELCGACVDATCSDAERACAADPACAEAAAWVVAAGLDNPTGRAPCQEQHPKAVATGRYAAIDGCMRSDCQADHVHADFRRSRPRKRLQVQQLSPP